MVNINKLKGSIIAADLTTEKLAEKMNINRATFYRKMQNNGDTFTIKEADMIANILQLTKKEAIDIFFSQYVA